MTEQLALLSRKNDPITSVIAGKTTDRARTRALVLEVLNEIGPSTDERLVAACMQRDKCTPSGVRSRRHELVKDELVVFCGYEKTEGRRKSQVWKVAP